MPITLRAPDDLHVHLRQAPLLQPVVRETARWFARALAMPNTVPPVKTAEDIRSYRREILASLLPGQQLEPLLVFKLGADVAPASVTRLVQAGAVGGKLYPQGVTTNSADGVAEVESLYPVLEAMEAHDLVLEVHAEAPGAFSLDREAAFLPTIEHIVARYPDLRIVIEHVSSADTVELLADLPETVAATVTVHHLLLTLDDVIGAELRPHHFCKPIAKRRADRDAIREAVLSGNPRFFFGSDSAPHPRTAKESASGAAGVYTAPVAVPLLVELFLDAGVALTEAEAAGGQAAVGGQAVGGGQAGGGPSLEAFLSRYGAAFYGLPLNEGTITLSEREWVVPDECDGVVPFHAGARLRYDLTGGGGVQ